MLDSTTTEDPSVFADCNSTELSDYTNCFSDKLIESMYNISSSTATTTIEEIVCEEVNKMLLFYYYLPYGDDSSIEFVFYMKFFSWFSFVQLTPI